MLIGYVSDEQYVAIADVAVEFDQDGETIATARSTARGAIHADLPPSDYRVTLARQGFGSKSVRLSLPLDEPYQFRLLSNGLLGYVWPKWVRTGERSEFRVHAVEPYQLSLWRYGQEKEFIRLLGWFDEHGPRAVMQITPDGDYTQTGIQWNRIGYGSPHHTQFVTGPERSGLYYLHAKTESGAFFSFPWIVAPAQPAAKVAVVMATNDWCAYNNFGGRSNYVNASGLPPTPTVNARQDLQRYDTSGAFGEWRHRDDAYPPLSFERPELGNHVPEETQVTDPIRGRLASSMAPAEWRALAWLEREGFPHDVYAEHHLHTGALDVDAYDVVIISTHPEYWSRQMYQRIKSWVYERGGRFLYLGGNGLNCEVEFLDDATLHFRTNLPAERGELGYIDERGVLIESRFHRSTGESEATLTGLVTTDSGIMTGAPYRAIAADHWVFAGTNLQNGDIFGTESLHERCHGGASGHETDKMSPSSPENTVLLAKGLNPDDGGAEMVVYDTVSGGAVFSVGSITWPSSLLVDPAISTITANVLRRFLSHPAGQRLA
jgi:N,N-dimethylformamidase